MPKKKYKKGKATSLEDFIFAPPEQIRIKRVRKPKQIKVQSVGEKKIEDWLISNEVKYHPEKEFKDLINPKTGMKLRFDFFIPENKMCIEFDGAQHFRACVKFDADGKDSLEARVYRDELKNQYCINKNFKMVRIRYSQISLIAQILKDALH